MKLPGTFDPGSFPQNEGYRLRNVRQTLWLKEQFYFADDVNLRLTSSSRLATNWIGAPATGR